MKYYDAVCPICGTKNHNLDLEDSNGWMECEKCKTVTMVLHLLPKKKIPVYTGKQLTELFSVAR